MDFESIDKKAAITLEELSAALSEGKYQEVPSREMMLDSFRFMFSKIDSIRDLKDRGKMMFADIGMPENRRAMIVGYSEDGQFCPLTLASTFDINVVFDFGGMVPIVTRERIDLSLASNEHMPAIAAQTFKTLQEAVANPDLNPSFSPLFS